MNLVLNPDVVALNPPSLGRDLRRLTGALGNARVSFPATAFVQLRTALGSALGACESVDRYISNHFQFAGSSLAHPGLFIQKPITAAAQCADGLAWSSVHSSVSVGCTNTPYGAGSNFVLTRTGTDRYDALMVMQPGHLSGNDYRRWWFVKHFNDHWADPKAVGVIPVNQHLHCRLGNQRPCAASAWRRAQWVGTTNTQSAAFCPGVAFGGWKYMSLVRHVLLAAYADSRFTWQRQDGFVVDVGIPVGAADGHVTTSVEIYVTQCNEIHIRPTEHQPVVSCAFTAVPLDR